MKKYPGTLVTTNLDKSSAIFIRYPIINSLASDRLPIFLPINRHSQPKDKPLGKKLNFEFPKNTQNKNKVLGASAGHYASSAYALLVVVQQVALILI